MHFFYEHRDTIFFIEGEVCPSNVEEYCTILEENRPTYIDMSFLEINDGPTIGTITKTI